MSINNPVRHKPITIVVAPRVRFPNELRPGLERLGCPGCNHDMWLTRTQLRTIDGGADVTCRVCFTAV